MLNELLLNLRNKGLWHRTKEVLEWAAEQGKPKLTAKHFSVGISACRDAGQVLAALEVCACGTLRTRDVSVTTDCIRWSVYRFYRVVLLGTLAAFLVAAAGKLCMWVCGEPGGVATKAGKGPLRWLFGPWCGR